jgi:hypothetical protein
VMSVRNSPTVYLRRVRVGPHLVTADLPGWGVR